MVNIRCTKCLKKFRSVGAATAYSSLCAQACPYRPAAKAVLAPSQWPFPRTREAQETIKSKTDDELAAGIGMVIGALLSTPETKETDVGGDSGASGGEFGGAGASGSWDTPDTPDSPSTESGGGSTD